MGKERIPPLRQALGCIFLVVFSILSPSPSSALTNAEATFLMRRQLRALSENGEDLPDDYESKINVPFKFPNSRLRKAYIALQAWKKVFYSDPSNFTGNWVGPNVCDYQGVFCSPSLDDPKVTVVSGVDLNHQDIAGYLPVELGLLSDIALFHINSNRFCGIIPKSFAKLTLLYELDLSNNHFVGSFPKVVIEMKALKYLDIRFNDFEGSLPHELFNRAFDALILNNNRFESTIPDTIGNAKASLLVLANNKFSGCIPHTIGNTAGTLDEFMLKGNELGGCMPPEMGLLQNVTVVDVSKNSLVGPIPKFFSDYGKVEALDISDNKFTGFVQDEICKLPNLKSFDFSNNYFKGEGKTCNPEARKDVEFDDRKNCLPSRPNQRSSKECFPMLSSSVDCEKANCGQSSKGDKHDNKHKHKPPSKDKDGNTQSLVKPALSPPKTPATPSPQSIKLSSPPPKPPTLPPPTQSPPPPPQTPISPPPTPPTPSPPPQVFSPPPPVQSPPSKTPSPSTSPPSIKLPPNLGFQYTSPPPPVFPGY